MTTTKQNKRRQRFARPAAAAVCLSLLLLAQLFTATASAWFYFPAPENVAIQSAPDLPFVTAVYRLDSASGAAQIATVTDNSIPLDVTMHFYTWDDSVFCMEDPVQYFAFVYTYASNAPFAAADVLQLQSTFTAACLCTSVGNSYCFPCYTVSYAYGSQNNVDMDTTAPYHAARAATYTDIISAADLAGYATTNTIPVSFTKSAQQTLTDLQPAAFRHIEGDNETLRLVVYVKIEASETDLTNRLNEITLSSSAELTLNTTLALSSEFRTVPAYTGG